ncbi:MAG: hypothetical protein KGK07_17185 [Chloroflexota bacterium]|nr:hypothetical protein [Chloroflexota bacterium]
MTAGERQQLRRLRSMLVVAATADHRAKLQRLRLACASCGVEKGSYTLGCRTCVHRSWSVTRHRPESIEAREAEHFRFVNREQARQEASERFRGSATCTV